MAPRTSTARRIVDEAMRLFGERGYHATSVADIEAATGLAPGRGGLYRHFRSKRALLDAGVRRQIASNRELIARMAAGAHPAPAVTDDAPLLEQLRALARAGIERLGRERDLNRLLVRDLREFPDLRELAVDGDIRPVHAALATWLASHDTTGRIDHEALAAVLAGATAHFWLLRDVFGEHPTGVDASRYTDALARLTLAVLTADHDPPGSRSSTP